MAKLPRKYSPLEQKVDQLWQVYDNADIEKFWRVYNGFLVQAKAQSASIYQDAKPRPAKTVYRAPAPPKKTKKQPPHFIKKYPDVFQDLLFMACFLGLFIVLIYGLVPNKMAASDADEIQPLIKKEHVFAYCKANLEFKENFNPLIADSVAVAYSKLQEWTYVIPSATRQVMESKQVMEEKAALLKKTQTRGERKALESAYKNAKNEVMALERQLKAQEILMEREKARYNKAIAAYNLAMQKQQSRPVDKIKQAWERQMQLKTPQNLNKTNRAAYDLAVPGDKEWFFVRGNLGAELFRARHFKGKYYKMHTAHALTEIDTENTTVYKASLLLFYRKNLVKYDDKGAYSKIGMKKHRFTLQAISDVEKWLQIVEVNH